jgi:hypothetical protein
MRGIGDQRIIRKTPVRGCVEHDQNLFGHDGMGAEGQLAGCLARVQAARGLKPLPVIVDEGENREFGTEMAPGEPCYPVEFRIGLAVQERKVAQCLKPVFLVKWLWNKSFRHFGLVAREG